jgi:hypothetical protein
MIGVRSRTEYARLAKLASAFPPSVNTKLVDHVFPDKPDLGKAEHFGQRASAFLRPVIGSCLLLCTLCGVLSVLIIWRIGCKSCVRMWPAQSCRNRALQTPPRPSVRAGSDSVPDNLNKSGPTN